MEKLTQDSILKELQQITKEEVYNEAVKKLILKYYEARLAYWEMVDKFFTQKKGMGFQTYQDTKQDEWDGANWELIEDFHDWEDAIIGLDYYKEKIQKWK